MDRLDRNGIEPARLIRFPARSIGAVLVCRERNGGGWLTIAGAHGWLFGSYAEARTEARWLSHNLGLPIRELISEYSA